MVTSVGGAMGPTGTLAVLQTSGIQAELFPVRLGSQDPVLGADGRPQQRGGQRQQDREPAGSTATRMVT
jgi:hypothetical protein